jgi:CBS domain-containing protein
VEAAEVVALSEVMIRDVFTVPGDTSVAEVARSLLKSQHGSALIMGDGWLDGIFTERDILRAAAAGTDMSATTVSEWMTRDPVTVPPDTDTEDAADMMLAQGFRHLPVVEGRKVVGIVSLRDILRTRIRRAGS